MVSHRQWTLSVPRALRLVVVKEPSLFKLVVSCRPCGVEFVARCVVAGQD